MAGARLRRGRRAPGEPLRASWRPERPARPRRPGVRGVLAAYSWRVYAVPLLVAVTALVVVQTAGERAPAGGMDSLSAQIPGAASTTEEQPATPAISERPVPVELNIPSAELPAGGPFTQTGAATWRVVPGEGPKVGTGPRHYTYTVEIEDGLDPASFGGDESFAKLVDQTLADPRGWTSLGQISVQRVGPGFPNPTFRLSLTSPDTVHRADMCGYSIRYEASCFRSSEKRVLINLARWVRGAVAFDGDMLTYRQYAINHEIGHAFRIGLVHVGCPQAGGLAPVMMQQSFGVANNYVAQLNRAVGLSDQVKEDGLVCKPNAWPNPQAQPAG